MNEIEKQNGQFENELGVIGKRAAFLPDRTGTVLALSHVVQMKSISKNHVQSSDVKLDALKRNERLG